MNSNSVETERKPSKIKATAKFLFDVPSWVGAQMITDNSSWIIKTFKKIFRVPQKGNHEDFAEVIKRFKLSKEDIEKRRKIFFVSSLGFLALSILVLFYLASIWHHTSFIVILMCLTVFALFLMQAYLYSFWCFQIYSRSLNRNFKEWLSWIFRGRA